VIRYLYAGEGDAPWGATDGTGALTQRTVGLPGGAMMLINSGTPGTVWSYPNLHGDEIVTADSSGTRAAGHASYDPFGRPIEPTTGNIGTVAGDDAVPDTSNGNNADNGGWLFVPRIPDRPPRTSPPRPVNPLHASRRVCLRWNHQKTTAKRRSA
jgi:hypothetical protein